MSESIQAIVILLAPITLVTLNLSMAETLSSAGVTCVTVSTIGVTLATHTPNTWVL